MTYFKQSKEAALRRIAAENADLRAKLEAAERALDRVSHDFNECGFRLEAAERERDELRAALEEIVDSQADEIYLQGIARGALEGK